MIYVLDVAGDYECTECSDLARPRADRCTSCRDWQDHGVLPTSIRSAQTAAAEVGEVGWREGDEVTDRLCGEMADRLLTLERRRDRRTQPRRLEPLVRAWGDGRAPRPPRGVDPRLS